MMMVVPALMLVVVMMMVVLMLLTILIVMMMVVLMPFFIVMMVMMMLVLLAILIVVMMVLVLLTLFAVMVVVLHLVLMLVQLVLRLGERLDLEIVLSFNHRQQLCTIELIPRGRDNGCLVIQLAHLRHHKIKLLRRGLLRAAQDDSRCIRDLVVEKFTKRLHLLECLLRVHHSHERTQLHIRLVLKINHGLHDIRELAHTGRLDQDAVRMELLEHLAQVLRKIAHQRAADAAGIHLRNLDAGILQETAIDTHLSEFILDQDDLLTGERLLDHFLDERGLARAQESGNNVNFCHHKHLYPYNYKRE